HILMWINLRQQEFYHSLAAAMKAMRQDGSKLWLLIGLSFAYGIFHAAGPGHGKAVISSYMVANEVALRRGILLSFV
ncbi:MAG: delayed-early response protein/equilibrative nucleoside transporter, partial [Mesorhizobium sp.]